MTGTAHLFPGDVAKTPARAESIIAQVRRELVADDAGDPGRHREDRALLAESAVRTLWGGRVTAFVSVLALRDAREAICGRGAALPGGAADRPGSRE